MTLWIDQPAHHSWLEAESQRLLRFGLHCEDPAGGAAWLDDDGVADPARPVFTYITARMAHVYGLGALRGTPGCAPVAAAMLDGLRHRLHDSDHGGWVESRGPAGADGTVDGVDGPADDDSKAAYTHVTVLLAASTGVTAGLDGAAALLDDALAVLEEHFWEPAAGMFRDRWNRDWTVADDYRGVNANMHGVEALLAAADATGRDDLRRRALGIAERVVDGWARQTGWRIPEHFDAAWNPLPEYNADHLDDPFKPYGATVGHGLEWSRLLLHLSVGLGAEAPDWLVPAAEQLYARASADGWSVDGAPGFVYTTDWAGRPVVRTRMHWVVAEAIGAAATLHRVTGRETYALDYQRWWDYAATYLLDYRRGSWHHELDEHNRPANTVWPGKPDLYHCYQATLIPRIPIASGVATTAARPFEQASPGGESGAI